MYNAGKNPISSKNRRFNDTEYSKFKSYCSCPTNFQFKTNQSKWDDKFKTNAWIKATQESEKFLQDELKKYGLAPKTKKAIETKHHNSSKHGGRVDINLRSVPNDRVIKVNIKEIMCKNKYKSKTEPNLSADRYVEDLKKEIKLKKREIPSMPEKYKKKYLKSLKEELLLNNLTTRHENSQQLNEIKKEIETYRLNKFPIVESDKSSTRKKKFQQTEVKITVHPQDKKRKHHAKEGSVKGHKRKEKNSESSDGYGMLLSLK